MSRSSQWAAHWVWVNFSLNSLEHRQLYISLMPDSRDFVFCHSVINFVEIPSSWILWNKLRKKNAQTWYKKARIWFLSRLKQKTPAIFENYRRSNLSRTRWGTGQQSVGCSNNKKNYLEFGESWNVCYQFFYFKSSFCLDIKCILLTICIWTCVTFNWNTKIIFINWQITSCALVDLGGLMRFDFDLLKVSQSWLQVFLKSPQIKSLNVSAPSFRLV